MITQDTFTDKPDGVYRLDLDNNLVVYQGNKYYVPGDEADAWQWYEAKKRAGDDEYYGVDITAIPDDYWRNPPSTWITTLTDDEVDERQAIWDAANPDDDYGVA